MSFEIALEAAAVDDVAAAHAYYGEPFLEELERVFAHISERPLMFPVVHADVHRALLHRFPYALFFIVEAERVVVLAVHHQRRDPATRPRSA